MRFGFFTLTNARANLKSEDWFGRTLILFLLGFAQQNTRRRKRQELVNLAAWGVLREMAIVMFVPIFVATGLAVLISIVGYWLVPGPDKP